MLFRSADGQTAEFQAAHIRHRYRIPFLHHHERMCRGPSSRTYVPSISNLVTMQYESLLKNADSTRKNHEMAASHFRTFLESKGWIASHRIEEADCKQILDEFATYIVVVCKRKDGECYSLGTSLQIYSGAKEKLRKDNP